MNAPQNWTLCLDFGTAYSKAAAAPSGAWARFQPESMRPLMLSGQGRGANAFLLDSAVFVDDDRILFGRAALARAAELGGEGRMALRSFKTLLSVSDLDRALNTSAPGAIDPQRMFTMRHLVVLYLAYLLAAVDRAEASDPVLSRAANVSRRYAAPAWRSGDSAGMHGAVMRLFGEAESLRMELGSDLLSVGGVSLQRAEAALPRALAAPRAYRMGLVFEATAAAAYTSIGLENAASHLIVVDMGAGTTDIAAVARNGTRMEEIEEARVTLKQAGDFIDQTLANTIVEQSRWAKTPAQRAQLWRALIDAMRDIKESVFLDGRAKHRYEGRTLSVSMADLERHRDFREFRKSLEQAYDHSLAIVSASAQARDVSSLQAVAVGGGSAAPFIQGLMLRRPKGGKVRVEPRPATPEWAFAPEFGGNLAPIFPQLAIAMGGALAPEAIVAAGGVVSPA